MDVLDLLLNLRAKGTTITLDDAANTLRLRGKTENLTAQDKDLIRTHKTALMDFIRTERVKQQGYATIAPVPAQPDYALSDGQRRLWYLSQADEEAVAYNIPSVLELAGPLDAELFAHAIDRVIERHEILRTVLRENAQGEPRQHILSAAALAFRLRYADLSAQPDAEGQVRAEVRQDMGVAFHLGQGPLLRASLFRLAPDRHVFYYNMHHIISDGWSMQLLTEQVLTSYLALVQGQQTAPEPLSIHYKDYAAWHLQQLSGDSLHALENYWKEKFAGELPTMQLPTAKTRPALLTHNGAFHTIGLGQAATHQLRQLSQQLGGTLFMGLLACLKGMLYRYTGQEDVIIGSPIAGREHADLEEQIGFYVNTLALRTQFSGQDSFETLFERVKATTLGAFQHQLYPFDRLVETVGVRRDPSRNPLFDVLLNLQSADAASTRAAQAASSLVATDFVVSQEVASKFDLAFRCYEQPDALSIRIEYNTDVLDAYFIEQFGRHFGNFVAAILRDATQPIGRIEYLSEAEKSFLPLTNTETDFAASAGTLLTEFATVVAQHGARVALTSPWGEELTYAELDAQSSQLAHFLLQEAAATHPALPLTLVALALPQGPAVVVAILAAWKAGAAYLPLDSRLPAARQHYMLAHSQAQLTLTAQGYAAFQAQAATYPTTAPVLAEQEAAPTAYVIYTSGSTGQPKGVAVGHGALRNYCQWFSHQAGLRQTDVAALLTSYSFDLGYTVLFPTLLTGGRLCVVRPEAVLEQAGATLAWLDAQRVSVLKLTPSLVQGLVLAQGRAALAHLGALRLLVCGGAPMAGADMAALLERNPALTIFNHYGPTETTIGVCFQQLDAATIGAFVAQPVLGGPIAHVELLVADGQQQLVPVGVVGELLIGGRSLAQGYLHEAGLTAAKFVAHPLRAGQRVYRSGDQVVRQADGRLRFVGRVDEQVKVRGYRVEPGEVQHALLQLPSIAQAAVVASPQAEGDAVLIAYVVAQAGQVTDEATLRAGLQAQLPAYMVPSYFVALTALPVTANGKLDTKALPDPDQHQLSSRAGHYQAPQGEVESKLAQVWAGVLRREAISRHDNFYDLGGDSIKAVMVVSRLKQAGYSLKVSDVLRTPVLNELAAHAQVLTRQISQAPATGTVELSPIQHEYFGRPAVDQHHYNQSLLLTSEVPLDGDKLRQSLAQLLAHHDALRLRFTLDEAGSWRQHYAAPAQTPVLLPVHDLSALAEQEARAEQLALSEALQASFDLATGPLFQAAVFRHAGGTDELLLLAHHLVVDGVSWRILLEDLAALYAQAQQGQALALPPKTDSLQAWQAQQQVQAQREAVRAQLPYWRAQDQAPVPALPRDNAAGSNLVADGAVRSFELDADLTQLLLTQTHRAYGTQVQELLLTALALALRAQWGLAPLRLTLEGHGREWLGAELDVTRTVGWFTSKYPLLLDLRPAGPDALEALLEVKEAVRRVPAKGIGYGLLRYLHPDAPLDPAPASELIFNYLGDFGAGADTQDPTADVPTFTYSGQARGASVSAARTRPAALEVSALIVAGQLRVSVSYSHQQYQAETIAQLLGHYEQGLRGLITTLAATTERHLTPSDLTFPGLRRPELAALVAQLGAVQDVYGLTPLQEGMYYHWVQDPGSRAHAIQVAYRLQGALQLDLLTLSYAQLVASYDVLRTSFTHHYAGRALQLVQAQVASGFSFVDLSPLPGPAQATALAQEKAADLARGFDLSRGSQMRLRVVQLAADQYELLWSHHHCIMDGWCSRLLIQQFTQLYQGLVSGRPVQLHERHRYADYLRWLDQREAPASLAYWKHYLAGYEQLASLPRKAAASTEAFVQRQASFQLAGPGYAALQQLCRQQGVTLNTVVQSAWGVLLSRYANTPDVVFGTVVSGRPGDLVGVEEMVGLFINTIPVRVQVGQGQRVGELIARQHQHQLAGEPHHYRQLAEVQAQSTLGRQLFDHILVFENLTEYEGEMGAGDSELHLAQSEVNERTSYDLHLTIVPREASLDFHLIYNTQCYEDFIITGLEGHFKKIIGSFCADIDQEVAAIECLSAAESTYLLDGLNDTAADFPADKTLVDMFAAQVARRPQAVALRFGDAALTYQQLDEASNQLSHYLRQQHEVQLEDRVAIQLERGPWMVIAILATLKAGGAYVPIDPAYPAERIAYLVEDSQCKVCLDAQQLDLFALVQAQYSTAPVPTVLTPTSLAYVLYTSGSTGKPKGCMLEHRGVVNRLEWMWKAYAFTSADVILQKTTFTFDVSVWELLLPLGWGCEMVLCEKDDIYSPTRIAALIARYGVTCLHFVPSMLNAFIGGLWDSEADRQVVAGLRCVMTSGEALALESVQKWYSELAVPIYNLYGPTEASIDVTYYNTTPESTKVPIGKPVANTQILLLDGRQCLVPLGATGEIYIGGIQLARGYWNREELTQEKFVAHPYQAGARLYRTGDLGRWLPDGNVEYLGRTDFQVKIRGYRIELGEIESALLANATVAQAAVLATTPTHGTAALVAYIVPAAGQALQVDALRTALQAQLPAYMVPSYFVALAALPLTANGKLDRKALPEPGQHQLSSRTTQYEVPQGEVESKLAQVWAGVLRREVIGRHDNFYDLGGDSIKSILVVSRLRQQGYSVEVADILGYPVLAELAKRATKLTRQISQAPATGTVELSPIQHEFLGEINIDRHFFNQAVLLTSASVLDEEALRQSLTKLLSHHDALRLRFTLDEAGAWHQAYAPTAETLLPVHDLSALAEQEARARQLALSEALQASFDLASGPLFQAAVFRHAGGTDELLLLAHHLVVDGVSWRILLEDLAALYAQAQQGQALALPPKTDSLQAWQAQQQVQAQREAVRAQLPYWQAQDQAPVPALPRDNAAGSNLVADGAVRSFELDADLTQLLLTQTHRAYGTQVQELLLTALALALRAQWGLAPLRLTLEGHGREWLGAELDVTRTVGWFTSKYPLLLDLRPAGPDALEALLEVKEAVRRVPAKGIGYGLLRYLHPDAPLDPAPASELIFNYLGDFGAGADTQDPTTQASAFTYSGQARGASVSAARTRPAALEVSALIVAGQLRVSVSYSHQQYQAETIAALLGHYEQGLRGLITTLAATTERHLTPSDLTFPGLRRPELAALVAQLGAVQDVYGLTPLQEGMYYHWVQDPGSRAHAIQVAYRLQGALQLDLLTLSYAQLVASYDVLRTCFTHHYAGRALQLVQAQVASGFSFVDLSPLPGPAQATALAQEKAADLARGFDLSRGSQMRLRVVQLAADQYELLWSHHHCIMDGWCSRLLIQQFTQLYQGLVSGRPVQLHERHRYADYLRWLDQREAPASLAYWKHYLADYEQLASLPRKAAADENLPYAQAEVSLDVEPGLVSNVYQLCRQQGVTLNTVVQSAWGVLLSRYANTPDVVFGTVVSGRPGDLVGVEEMVGLFINTIPVRVQYDRATTVKELLQNMQRQALSTAPHHYSPLANVRAQSELGRDLFNHVLVFENLENNSADPTEDVENAALKITGRELYESTNFDVHINCIPTADTIRLEFKYNTNVFESGFMAALKEHFVNLLTGFIAAPEQEVDVVEHLSAAEQHHLLVALNDTAVAYELDKTVIDLFTKQVAQTPARPAVVCGATTLTYQQLDAVTNQLAQYLLEHYGVQANDFVGIQLYRSEWLLIAVLGALKAGAAYVPIDPEYPQERIDYIRSDSRSKVLLDEQEISRFRAAQGRYAEQWTAVRQQPADVAYAIYTSGTTGQPKGVPIQHHSLTNYISYAAQTYCPKACANETATCPSVSCQAKVGATFPLFTSFSFDLTVTCIFAPLVTGGKVVVYGQEGLDDVLPDVFWGTHGISVVKCTPTHVGVLSELGQRPTAVQKIIVGGEQLKEKHVAYLLAINPNMVIYNEYGPTETTVGATVARIDQHTAAITIGMPIANTQVYVLDRRGRLAAVGVAGEIVIAGEQLSAGYLHRPDLTADKFVPHPYAAGTLMYRTGDSGKVLPDGNLLYFGRRDDQVKVRGYRIELGEVENALLLRPEITQSVVIATEMGEEKVLVAYFTSPEPVLLPELKGFLAATLPDYMVPAYLVQLKELPVTVNGKVDKRQLPSPDSLASGAEFGPVAPRNAVEEKLLTIWKQVLKKDTISIRTNFFDLGGDSIKIILMVAKIKSNFKIALDSAKLFHATTIEEQAALISQVTEQAAGISVAPVQRSYPLTEIQEVYWAVCQDPATSVAYNISMAYQLVGFLEVEKLKTAFQQLQNRHEVLRTVFRYDAEAYNVRQWVVPLEQLPEAFLLRDLRGQHLGPDDLTQLVSAEVTKPFDFVNGPLIQLQVVQYKVDEFLILFNMHHIISDAFSIHIIVRELFRLYHGQVAGQAVALPKLPIQFKDFADWSRRHRNEAKLAESATFWKGYLANYQAQIQFPTRKTDAADGLKAAIYRQVVEDEALVQQLRTWVGTQKGTLYMALLTLFKALCYLETDQADLTLVTPVSTRDHEEVKDLIGLFLNTVFIRTQVADQESFASLFGKVRASVQEVMLHKQFPYLSIVDQIHKTQEQPFFNVGLNLNPLNAHADEAGPDLGLELLPLTKEENFVKAQLWLDITEHQNALAINYSYQHLLFEERDIQQLASQLERLLALVLQQPTRPLLEIREEMLAAARHEQKESARKLRSTNRLKLMTGKSS